MEDTVLIVEDDADVVDLLRYNLSKAGFGVLIARDGLKGLEIARKDRPDLVVLDLRLPQMDGYAVCKALKNDSDTAALPIVILTARAEPRREGSRFGDWGRRLHDQTLQSARARFARKGLAAALALRGTK